MFGRVLGGSGAVCQSTQNGSRSGELFRPGCLAFI